MLIKLKIETNYKMQLVLKIGHKMSDTQATTLLGIQVCSLQYLPFGLHFCDLMRRERRQGSFSKLQQNKVEFSFLLQGAVAKKCPGADVQSFPCNSDPCHMRWSAWGNCSESCARGSQRAYTECIVGNIKPKDEDLNSDQYEWKDCASIDEFENHAFEWIRDCNSWNRSTCPSACEGIECQDFAKCVDISTDTDKLYQCQCQMGRVLLPETGQCIVPLPPPPTPRPIPVLEVEVKTATTYATRSASTVLIVFVGTTLILFAAFR